MTSLFGFPALPVFALLAFAPTLTSAQVTLFQDFDNGALDVGGSSVDLSLPASPGITLEPRRFVGNWPGDHWWVSFRVEGVAGLTPRFRLPTANAFQAYSDDHRWVWTATPTVESSWSFFDNGFVDGSGFFRSANTSPFVEDVIYVAYAVPYPYQRTVDHSAGLVGHPFVRPTASADANLVLGQTPGTSGGGYLDDLGRSVPALDLYGYVITDGSGRPKRKVVLVGGNHSGEPTGSWTLEGFVDFAISDDPEAVALRRVADVYVYPQVDPEGRFSGYFRSNPENPTENHNRAWDDPTGFSDIGQITAAMAVDTGGDVDVFFDFHGFGSSPTDIGYFLPTNNALTKVFLDAFLALEPGLLDFSFPNPQPGATAARWAATSAGLSAEVTMTPEAGTLANQPVARFETLGANAARAVLAAFENVGTVKPPGSGATFRTRVLARDPVMYLPLDETGGGVASDASGNGRSGSYIGAVELSRPAPFPQAGRSAMRLQGTGAHVRVNDFPYATPGGAFTLAFWFRHQDIAGSGEQYLVSHGSLATPNSLNVFFQETPAVGTGNVLRTIVLDANDPGGLANFLDVKVAPVDGEWHFYTLVVDGGGGATLYLDGLAAQARAGIGGDAFDPAGALRFGVDAAGANAYGRTGAQDGFLDEVVLFDRALPAAAVQALARSPRRWQSERTPSVQPSAAGKTSAEGHTCESPREPDLAPASRPRQRSATRRPPDGRLP